MDKGLGIGFWAGIALLMLFALWVGHDRQQACDAGVYAQCDTDNDN